MQCVGRPVITRRGVAVALAGGALGALAGKSIPAQASTPPGKADRIVVVKQERTLFLLREGEVMTSYRVALGRQPRGTKI